MGPRDLVIRLPLPIADTVNFVYGAGGEGRRWLEESGSLSQSKAAKTLKQRGTKRLGRPAEGRLGSTTFLVVVAPFASLAGTLRKASTTLWQTVLEFQSYQALS